MNLDTFIRRELHDIFDKAPLIIRIFDLNRQPVWANAYCQKKTGNPPGSTGKPCYSLWGLDQPCSSCPVDTVKKTGRPADAIIEAPARALWANAGGSFHINAVPLFDDRRHVVGVMIYCQEQPRSDASHPASLDAILASISDGVIVTDSHGRITLMNQAASDMTGWSMENARNQPLKSVLTFADSGPSVVLDNLVAKALSLGRTEDAPTIVGIRSRDGDRRRINFSVTPVMDGDNGPDGCVVALKDVTWTHQIQEQLGQSEEKFRNIVEGAPEPIFIQTDHKFAYLNPAACELFGIASADELIGTPVMDRFHPDHHDVIRERINTLNNLKARVKKSNEYRIIRVDGREVWAETSGEPIHFNGRDGALVFVRDISGRKEAENKIQEQWKILQLFVEYTPAAIAMFDRDMRYVVASRRFKKDYGIDGVDILGKSHYDIFPEIPERWKAIHQRCLAGATERCEEEPFMRADGGMDWIRWEIRPWLDKTGRVSGVILFSEVVTQQKKINQQLQESEEKFRALFQKHSAIKLIIDPETGNIVDANDAAVAFYGWPKDQLCRMTIFDINEDTPETIRESMAKVKDRSQFQLEFRHKLADGSSRDLAVYSSRIEVGGQTLLHSIIHDITETKKAQKDRERLNEQLFQAQKMESIGHLAGGVAHDFNNMLGVIIGNIDMAMEQIQEDSELYEYLYEIGNAARRSVDLTRQLLAFARKQDVIPKVLDLNFAVDGMLKMMKRLMGEDIELAWHPGARPMMVKIDPGQVDQLLANFCVNARDAIQDVGKVTIETAEVCFDQEYCDSHLGFNPGDYIMLAVSDNGCGMDKETMARLFEPFFTTKGLGKGTGLGLATVYGIVKQNNGFINVYSEIGQGTSFKVYLPRYKGRENASDKTIRKKPVSLGHETILLVEDEPLILKMITTMLQRLGYTVLTANSPEKALQVAQEYQDDIHLLMTDVVMPEMNGRDLVSRFLARYPDLKYLFMSGYTANVIANHGILDETVYFIQKPFTKENLSEKIREVLATA